MFVKLNTGMLVKLPLMKVLVSIGSLNVMTSESFWKVKFVTSGETASGELSKTEF